MRLKNDEERALVSIANSGDMPSDIGAGRMRSIMSRLIVEGMVDADLSLTNRGKHVVSKLTKKNDFTESEMKENGDVQGQTGKRMEGRTRRTVDRGHPGKAPDQSSGSGDGPVAKDARKSNDPGAGDLPNLPRAD